MEKSKVSIQFLQIFRQSGDVLFFFYAHRLRGYTATAGSNGGHVLVVNVLRWTSELSLEGASTFHYQIILFESYKIGT